MFDRDHSYSPHTKQQRPARKKRWVVTLIAKFGSAVILLCYFLYIPVYYILVSDQVPVLGWATYMSRDIKVYIQPDEDTSIYKPQGVCPEHKRSEKNDLFLLIIVCSATYNFEQRIAIRETWGSYKNYRFSGKILNSVREKYKDYNYTYDLYEETNLNVSVHVNKLDRRKNSSNETSFPRIFKKHFSEKPYENQLSNDGKAFAHKSNSYSKSFTETTTTRDTLHVHLNETFALRNSSYRSGKDATELQSGNTDVAFRLVFLLGLPSQGNVTDVQKKIDEEVEKYSDIIQEGFMDSYNNLTLKSIMMLKWIKRNCNESVRYILKADDDMYINVRNLVENLQNISKTFDTDTKSQDTEYLLMGDLIRGARPIKNSRSKWYSPRYMYSGRVYPRYLSGTGYVFSSLAGHALYAAALTTPYFHMEDVFITGMCSLLATPRITPRDVAGFSFVASRDRCAPYTRVTTHHVTTARMRRVALTLTNTEYVDRCERIRLTRERQELLKLQASVEQTTFTFNFDRSTKLWPLICRKSSEPDGRYICENNYNATPLNRTLP